MHLTDNHISQIQDIVSFEASASQPHVPTGSRTEGRIFERKVNSLLLSLVQHAKITTSGKIFDLYGFNREFDSPAWELPNTTILFEAKSAKANKRRTCLDGNAHERLVSQIHRAAEVSERNPARPVLLVVCLNGVWSGPGKNWLEEFRAAARRTERGCTGDLRVVFLSTADEYLSFFTSIYV